MRHKYGAKKVIITDDGTMFEVEELKKYNITDVKGQTFDSKAEGEYYLELKRMIERREIAGFGLQPQYILQENPKIVYKADFSVVYFDGSHKVIDVKGVQTQAFRLKVRMFKAKFPNMNLVLVMKKGKRFVEVPA